MGAAVRKTVRAALRGASLLGAAACLCACRPKTAPALAQPPAPAATAAPTSAPAPAAPWERLCACAWVDAYDSGFILTFDALGSQMVERNDAAGIRKASRVMVEEGSIVLYDEMGLVSARLPYTLEGDTLCIDYGGDLGELEYKAVR